ncbi:MAG: RNA polymerase sigma factor [Clostridiales bacterium]|nr:RNA polymerase sigma factor [Clostridiales bacterium]
MLNKRRDCGLADLLEGDKTAFDSVYEELKIPVFTVIYRITQDRMLAEDVMHDSFIKLFQPPHSSRIRNPRAWIYQMARNLAIDSVRKNKTDALPENMPDSCKPMEDAVIDRADTEAAINLLSREEREIVTLHINAGLKFREIAEIIEIPLGTVLWKYQKAIGALRSYLNGGSI